MYDATIDLERTLVSSESFRAIDLQRSSLRAKDLVVTDVDSSSAECGLVLFESQGLVEQARFERIRCGHFAAYSSTVTLARVAFDDAASEQDDFNQILQLNRSRGDLSELIVTNARKIAIGVRLYSHATIADVRIDSGNGLGAPTGFLTDGRSTVAGARLSLRGMSDAFFFNETTLDLEDVTIAESRGNGLRLVKGTGSIRRFSMVGAAETALDLTDSQLEMFDAEIRAGGFADLHVPTGVVLAASSNQSMAELELNRFVISGWQASGIQFREGTLALHEGRFEALRIGVDALTALPTMERVVFSGVDEPVARK